jgi:hypothetical protein
MHKSLIQMFTKGCRYNLLNKALMKADLPTLAEPCKIKELFNMVLG